MKTATEVIEALNILQRNSSTLAKIELLKEYLKSPMFKEVIVFALDGTKHFNIKKLPKINTSMDADFTAPVTWEMVKNQLNMLANKSGASNLEKGNFAELLRDPDMYDLATRILKKKLKCGVNSGLVNKAFPRTIKIMPYQRCSLTDKLSKIQYPAWLEVKEDGMFINTFLVTDAFEYRTRPGNLFTIGNQYLQEDLFDFWEQVNMDGVLIGEFRIDRDGVYLSRKEGNGLLNSINKGEGALGKNEWLRYIVWDFIPIADFWARKCYIPLKTRMIPLGEMRSKNNTLLATSGESVGSKEEALTKTQEWIDRGDEGGVLKDLNSLWQDHTCPLWIKLKAEKVCELEIIGWEYGEEDTKYSDMMGSVRCMTSCGKLEVNVSGWNDEERSWNWDELIGKIISVKFNEVIDSKSKKTISLFLPRVNKDKDDGSRAEFVDFRDDKSEADNLEYILNL